MAKGVKQNFVITLVILILVFIGVIVTFNPLGTLSGAGKPPLGGCTGNYQYTCTQIFGNTAGQLGFQFSQNTGKTEYNVELSCVETLNQTITNTEINGIGWKYLSNYNNSISSGESVSVNSVQCYSGASALNNLIIGTSIEGVILVKYTNDTNFTNNSSHTYIAANFALKAV